MSNGPSRLSWALLLLMHAALSCWAQEDLSDDVLIERASIWQATVENLRAQLTDATRQSSALRVQIEEQSLRLRTLALPSEPIPQEQFVWEQTRAQLDWQQQRLAVTRRQLVLLTSLQRLRQQEDSLLVLQIDEGRLVDLAMEELTPFVTEIEARAARGIQLPEGWEFARRAQLGAARAGLAARVVSWQEVLAEGPAELQKLQTQAAATSQRVEILQRDLEQAQLRHAEAQKRQASYTTLQDLDESVLAADFSRRYDLWRDHAERLAAAVAPYDALDADIAAVDATLAAVVLPRLEDIQVEGDLKDVRKARKDLALAGAQETCYESLDVLLTRRLELTGQDLELLSTLQPQLEGYWTETVELDVMRETLHHLGSSAIDSLDVAGVARLSDELAGLRAQRAAMSERRRRRTESIASLGTRREANHELLKQVRANLPALQQTRDREEAWAYWSVELKGMEPGALLSAYQSAAESLSVALLELEQRRGSCAEGDQRVGRLETGLQALIDPLVRQVQLREQEQRSALFEALSAGNPLPPAPVASQVQAVPPEGDSFELSVWIASLERARSTFLARENVFKARITSADQVVAALDQAVGLLNDLETSLQTALALARRRYGAGELILERVEGGSLPPSELPADMAGNQRRDRVRSLQLELDGLKERRSRLADRRWQLSEQALNEQAQAQRIGRRLELLVRKLAILRRLAELELGFAELARDAELGELESKQREQRILADIERETSWLESFLLLFASERADNLTEILRGYYEGVLELRFKRENLAQRLELTAQLVELLREEQQLIEELLPLLAADRQRLGLAVEVSAAHARAALAEPALRSSILSELSLELDRHDPALVRQVLGGRQAPDAVLPQGRAAALEALTSRVFARRAELQGNQLWQDELQLTRGRKGRLGKLEEAVAFLEELQAELQATDSELTQRLGTLRGRPAGPRPADSLSVEERQHYLVGDIGALRAQRLDELIWEAEKTGIWLLLLPVIAFLLIRMANVVGNRLVNRVQKGVGGPDDYELAMVQKEREDRARTLVGVFRAAWTIIVVLLSGIYLLKALRIDVTPIVASAGILGLAVAFGMQPLMRDWFAGFFILLENQYKLGDMISLSGTTGIVERITLRLTIVRDPLGVLHFIPNGHVDMVSNLTKDFSQANLVVGVSYDHDPDVVIASLQRVGTELRADPAFGRNILDFTVLGVDNFGDSSVDLRVAIKVRPNKHVAIGREARRRIKQAFDKEGIEIPFPQRVVHTPDKPEN